MKIIEFFVLKSFGIVYVCVKSMVGEWCGIFVINRKIKEYLCKQEHRFP
jgi:hypothetical protein